VKKYLIIIATMTVVAASWSSAALAWGGSQWFPDTCGAEVSTPKEGGGSWRITVTEGATVVFTGTVPATYAFDRLGVGIFAADAGLHTYKFTIANAADANDGKVSYTKSQINCVAPAGAKGDKGDRGADGTNGAKGDTGSQGAVGSTGAAGANGSVGAQGERGATGATGVAGVAVVAGANGSVGAAGKPGASGKRGKAGKAGKPGARGKAGFCPIPKKAVRVPGVRWNGVEGAG